MLRALLLPLLQPTPYTIYSMRGVDFLQIFALRQREGAVITGRTGATIQLRG